MTAVRFDPATHTYFDHTGSALPSITQMLRSTGWIDDTWFTEESRARGTSVHLLTARYDTAALDLLELDDLEHKGWVAAYDAFTHDVKPAWDHVEVPMRHGHYRYGGTIDRVGTVLRQMSVCEVKTGQATRSHQIQTALQAMLAASQEPGLLPARHWQRLSVLLDRSGRYKLDRHTNPRDFDEAERIVRRCCC